MKKIMFVCHGNICRSPMAEFIMKSLAKKCGASELYIESSATSSEEIGNSVYPPAVTVLAQHGIGCEGKRARRFTANDYEEFDMVIVMEDYNIGNLARAVGNDAQCKVWKLLDFIEDFTVDDVRCKGGDISDPWYHGNFYKTYKEIESGCKGLLKYLGY